MKTNIGTHLITSHKYWHISFIIKPSRFTNFRNLFCHETLHVSDSSSTHYEEFIHCTLSNGLSEVSVSCQNKFVKLVRLVGFIIKKFVTMHGHVNVKLAYLADHILKHMFKKIKILPRNSSIVSRPAVLAEA